MNETQLRDMVFDEVQNAGSQKALASRIGVSQQYLGDFLKGRRDPGEKILNGFGLKRVVTYVPKKRGKHGL